MPDVMTYRLNSTDEMLYNAGRNLGSARIIQVLWRFPSEVTPTALQAEWDRLNLSRLSRQVAPARVPGARRKWVEARNAEPLREHPESLTEATVTDWIDAQVRAPLPVGSDALWRLATAPYRGGSLVSLTVPHYRSDGIGVFNALAARASRLESRRNPGAALTGSDLGEALGQTSLAVTGSARWAARLLVSRSERTRIMAALRGGGSPAPAAAEPRFFVTTILDVDVASWEESARAHGGTPNSLFVEIAANLVRARGGRDDHATIDVGIPMSLRRSDADGRANALVVVPLEVPAGAPQHEDLRRTRRDTKALLGNSGEQSATLVPEPVWHLLPGRYADRLKVPGAQQTDVVASNFGHVPDAVVHFAGKQADGVALRTMNVPGLVPGKARLRASLCLLQVGDRLIVTVTGMPDQFGDAGSLYRLVVDELAAWGLRARRWCAA
jgi:diacylglycerol O-acyltransferase